MTVTFGINFIPISGTNFSIPSRSVRGTDVFGVYLKEL